jgi:Flp pilus assembly protein TadB
MRIHSTLFALALTAVAMAGCHDEDNSPNQSASEKTKRTNAEIQTTVGQERDRRLQVEARLTQQQSAAGWWQSAATVLAVAAITFLIVGVTLGSSARHESEH